MPRVRYGAARHRRKIRVLRAAKGYRGGRSKLYRTALDAVTRSQPQARLPVLVGDAPHGGVSRPWDAIQPVHFRAQGRFGHRQSQDVERGCDSRSSGV